MPSFWAVRNKKKLVNQELKEKFLLKVAISADIKAKKNLIVDRIAWLSNYSFKSLVEDTIMSMLADIAAESFSEGMYVYIYTQMYLFIYLYSLEESSRY
jgi:hypothetical protein